MERDIPHVIDQVTEAFTAYEHALVTNDLEKMDELFCDDLRTIRFGTAECLFGIESIRSFRVSRSTNDLERSLTHTVISTYGEDFATVMTLYHRSSAPGKVGRLSQTWVRSDQKWQIVTAHVSVISA